MSFATVLKRRLAIVRLVLLALCLNLTAGMALHAAEHLRESAAVATPAGETAGASETARHEEGHGEVCAECLAHATSALLVDTAAATRAMPPGRTPAPRPGDAVFVPAPAHWRFASRDPPGSR